MMQILNAFSWGIVMAKNVIELSALYLCYDMYHSEASNKTFFDTESWIIDIQK